jgi:UDP-N-acetylmuramoyl-tripeptide--D-alanyl-D-alanine ligase
MPELFLNEIAEILNGTVVNAKDNTVFAHYQFDTRLITEPGTLFFAFKTDSGDGHRFIPQLLNKPGVGVIVADDYDTSNTTIPMIKVTDPLRAAQQLATYVRKKFRQIKYVGVTGSAGKTTTKEFIYQLLSHKYRAYRSYKNYNNWIGMPFSILNMSGKEEAAAFELAMSFPGIGEIDLLADILQPDVAVILNVFPVHMEFLKTIDNAAMAKSEILNHLDSDDAAFINGDSNAIIKRLNAEDAPKGRKIFFGKGSGNQNLDICLKEVKREKNQTQLVIDFYGVETPFFTSLVNGTQIENLFVAILVAQHLGMKNYEIQEAIKGIAPLSGRGTIYEHHGCTIIDETYNSNPEAVKKTLDWVDNEYVGPKIAILGDMLELGEEEDRYHKEVGNHYASLGFQKMLTVGTCAQKIAEGALESGASKESIHQFKTALEAGKYLNDIIKEKSILLFKASRGIALEKAIQEFTNE